MDKNVIAFIGIIGIVLFVGLMASSITTYIMRGDVMSKDLNEVFCSEKTCKAVCSKCIITTKATNEYSPCEKLYGDKYGNEWRQYWTCED